MRCSRIRISNSLARVLVDSWRYFSNTHGLASQLRRLHEMKVLWKIIPEFEHARGLLQFNEYHKYTVDEHSMQALENLTKFADAQNTVGATYRNIREKNILHLAILLHDWGKDSTRITARLDDGSRRPPANVLT